MPHAPHTSDKHHDQAPKARPDGEQDPELQNEGEGSRTAARRYDEHAEQAAEDAARVTKLSHDAAEALDGPEGEELRKADERGKNARHH